MKNYIPVHKRRKRVTLDFDLEKLPSKTKQSARDGVDINKLYEKYMKTGLMSQRSSEPKFGSFDDFDFMKAQNSLIFAKEKFAAFSEGFSDLPSSTRKEFDNNPEVFLNYLAIPENFKKAQEQGWIASPDNKASQTPPERSEGPKKDPKDQAGSQSPEGSKDA